jgi:hypothetical protein
MIPNNAIAAGWFHPVVPANEVVKYIPDLIPA